ncbi:uncharacterized protein AB9X84_008540 [Acanthopagrus schlegelii]
MAQFNTKHNSVLDDSYKLAIQKKNVSAGSSVKDLIAALEGSQSVAAKTTGGSHTPSPVFERRSAAMLTQNVKPSSLTAQSFKPAETQTNRDSSASSHQKNVLIKSAPKAKTNYSCKSSAPPILVKPAWVKLQSTIPPLAQQDSVSKVERLTDGRVENIISGIPPRPPVKQKPRKRILPDVLSLGKPPPKPSRPPRVEIHQFRRNLHDGPRTKMPLPVTPPPSRLCPSAKQAAALSQQMDFDAGYDDIGILNHPSPPGEEHPSKMTEADLSDENMYEELDDKWRQQAENFKKCQESTSRSEDENQVREDKQELKGTINSKQMKEKDVKGKEERKKQLKQQKDKKKKDQKEKKKFKFNKKGTTNKDFKEETSDSNRDETVEVVHITDDYMNTGSVNTGYGDLQDAENECGWSDAQLEVYDDIGKRADVCSGLNVQNLKEEGVYDNLANPDPSISVSPLPQPSTGEEVYDDIGSQKPPQPSEGYDIYEDIKEDCIYENSTEER